MKKHEVVCVAAAYLVASHHRALTNKIRRQTARLLKRMNWEVYCFDNELFLNRTLQMSLESFNKLLVALEPALKRDKKHGSS